ncbi:3-isopropylmalate dehydratase small subunit [Priestia endophytica]|jgi:3-isopropylmalate/(R)-2-methylmalate dehydratase small subunit|uniref:3-isopropylmalate dehydratase small subunit n=1 Tax=Priestia endophytica DSM 13796 TaxID=1121089 RepID=A0A1I5WRI4_9BACI|nr:3-isopropylmalate dehydratase small subunit [Priestia endophytica]KYG36245.1 isopropylmalate isomerase [Priestia endophytica]MBG9815184.1 isopropylmalate isomerase [Priestia endophytica]SFQ22026.1 3-isopropylmalate/(R)-2-methylmalate dehydratase small subunit [Priestia endophytica DSM 13796]
MNPFTTHEGKVAGLNRANVDTDQIIPKQFLKRIERSGFGQFAFFDWRYNRDGSLNPDFELNQPHNEGTSILVSHENFGCGSSREHAPWALLDYGYKVVVAPSFADIFYQNCLKNGIVPIPLTVEETEYLLEESNNADYTCTVDLEQQTIYDNKGFKAAFDIDSHWKKMLINGWDEIDHTLLLEEKISAFEESR